jgi:hypothetical protein
VNMRPNIELDRSLRISDDFAQRIVQLTMQALYIDLDKTMEPLNRAADNSNTGNPKGQRKHFNRLVKALGSSVLTSSLDYTGTRKRFAFRIDCWGMPEDDLRSLYASRLTVRGVGANRPVDIETSNMVEITRHALMRIVQRADFVRPEDLVALLQNAWTPIQLALLAIDGDDDLLPGHDSKTGWILPVKTADGSPVYLVAKRGERSRLAIVTVLDDAKIRDHKRLDAVCDFIMLAGRDKEAVQANPRALLEAFRETVSSLWRAV